MTKKEIRKFFQDSLLKKPRNRWQATLREVDKGLWMAWSVIIFVSASATNNMGTLLIMIWLGLGILLAMYLFAKGK